MENKMTDIKYPVPEDDIIRVGKLFYHKSLPTTKIDCRDGPAVVWPNEAYAWFIDGDWVSFKQWCRIVKPAKEELLMIKLKYGDKYAD